MRDPFVLAPLPPGVGPELAFSIPAGVHELEEIRVGDTVHVNLESAHLDAMLVELVVPTERDLSMRTKRRDTGRDPDGGARRRLDRTFVVERGWGALLLVRQTMPHVEQRFLMHRLVLERGEDGLATAHRAMFAAAQIEHRLAEGLDDGLVCAPAKRQHLIAGRPGGLRSCTRHRQLDAVGIDATLEQPFHPGVDAW